MNINKLINSQIEKGDQSNFTGEVFLAHTFESNEEKLRIVNVHFAKGARTNWHTHNDDHFFLLRVLHLLESKKWLGSEIT